MTIYGVNLRIFGYIFCMCYLGWLACTEGTRKAIESIGRSPRYYPEKYVLPSFRQRYKKLTRYNLKYCFISAEEPDPTEIGTCTIVSWYEKRKRKIATVKVVETGEVIKDVLIDGSLCEDENAIYTLYEICKLYYLKQMKRNKEKKNCNKKKSNRKKK